jgi:hypothetical protein
LGALSLAQNPTQEPCVLRCCRHTEVAEVQCESGELLYQLAAAESLRPLVSAHACSPAAWAAWMVCAV